MKIKHNVPNKKKASLRINSDDLIKELLNTDTDEAGDFFYRLNRKQQSDIIAKALISLLSK